MSTLRFAIAALVLFLAPASFAQPASAPPQTKISSDTLVVRFAPGAAAATRANAHAQASGQAFKELPQLNAAVVRVAPGRMESALAAYRNNPNVVYAEPNRSHLLFRPQTDEGSEPGLGLTENFDDQWALHNTGQGFGLTVDPLFGTPIYPTYVASAGADINAPEGWAISTGSPAVAIAVLDSGVACDHLDIDGKCVESFNFVADVEGPDDFFGHGTHVAGIAAASTNNNIGIAGVGYDSSIGSLKVCYQAVVGFYVVGQCDDDDIAAALVHAADSPLNYKVVNMSLAGPDMGQIVANAIDYAWNAGLVLIGAAGNAYTTDIMYPAAYPAVIGVGATDYHDNLASFSSFGSTWVSVLAPGHTIMSTVPGNFCGQPAGAQSDCYDWKSGTSMAAPHVAGLAALLFAHNPGIDNTGVRALIEDHAAGTGTHGQDFTAWASAGRIDMAASLGGDVTPPGDDMQVASVVVSTVNVGRGSKRGQALVTVHDGQGNPVGGATVSGAFTGSYNEPSTASTNGSGVSQHVTDGTVKGGVAFQFCVTGVTHGTLSWDGVPVCSAL